MRGILVALIGLFGGLFVCACGGASVMGNERVAEKDQVTLNVVLKNDRFLLDNGLEVVLHPDRSAANTAIRIRYDVGGRNDPEGRAGLAHLFEHLMFLGPKGEPDFNQKLEARGIARSNAYTNHDHTEYHEEVEPSQVGYALWLEAARMGALSAFVDEELLRTEREVVKNEWRERYDNKPYGHVYAIARGALYGAGHPYGRPVIGTRADLDAITIGDVKTFASTYYRPNNATLVVCGAFDPAVLRPLVTELFGKIPPGPALVPRSFRAPKLNTVRRVQVRAAVESPMVLVGWPVPPPNAEGFEELAFSGDLLESSIWRHLVKDATVADDVDVSINPGRLGSFFVVTIRLKKGASKSTAVSAVNEALRKQVSWLSLGWDGFGDARSKRILGRIFPLEAMSGRAERILYDLEFYDMADGMKTELKRLQRIHATDVGAAAGQFLADADRVEVLVDPDPSAPIGGVAK